MSALKAILAAVKNHASSIQTISLLVAFGNVLYLVYAYVPHNIPLHQYIFGYVSAITAFVLAVFVPRPAPAESTDTKSDGA